MENSTKELLKKENILEKAFKLGQMAKNMKELSKMAYSTEREFLRTKTEITLKDNLSMDN